MKPQNRFYRCFVLFCCYFVNSLICFTLRPSPKDHIPVTTTPSYTTTDMTYPSSELPSSTYWPPVNNDTEIIANISDTQNATDSLAATIIGTTLENLGSVAARLSQLETSSPAPTSDDEPHACSLWEVWQNIERFSQVLDSSRLFYMATVQKKKKLKNFIIMIIIPHGFQSTRQ